MTFFLLSLLFTYSDYHRRQLAGSSPAEIEEIAEVEWKNYIADMAWEKVSKDFSDLASQAFLLHGEDYSVSDIAGKLDISEEKVYVDRCRVRKALLKEILRLDAQLG